MSLVETSTFAVPSSFVPVAAFSSPPKIQKDDATEPTPATPASRSALLFAMLSFADRSAEMRRDAFHYRVRHPERLTLAPEEVIPGHVTASRFCETR